MNERSDKNGAAFELLAKILCVAALAVAVSLIFVRLLQNQGLGLQCQVQKAELQDLTQKADALRATGAIKDARVKLVEQDIQQQIKTKNDLQIEMSDVLARVKILQEQQDKYDELREQINGHLQRMDEYYMRARQQDPGVQPP